MQLQPFKSGDAVLDEKIQKLLGDECSFRGAGTNYLRIARKGGTRLFTELTLVTGHRGVAIGLRLVGVGDHKAFNPVFRSRAQADGYFRLEKMLFVVTGMTDRVKVREEWTKHDISKKFEDALAAQLAPIKVKLVPGVVSLWLQSQFEAAFPGDGIDLDFAATFDTARKQWEEHQPAMKKQNFGVVNGGKTDDEDEDEEAEGEDDYLEKD